MLLRHGRPQLVIDDLLEALKDAVPNLHGMLDEKSLWPGMARYECQLYLAYKRACKAIKQAEKGICAPDDDS